MSPQDAATRSFTSDRSPASNAVDGIFRRLLKISDPSDADQVAKGLLARYSDEAQKIKREQEGLPFSVYSVVPSVSAQDGAMVRPEAKAANDALDVALSRLTSDPDLADLAPELRGWSITIRRASADGLASARFAVDATERDRAFGARRTLGDYARLARYAGAVTQCASDVYCRVAQACDGVANVMLVLVGDALGEAGVTRGGNILQVSAASLQARRDSVIAALRNLQQPSNGDDQESWPRGPVALQQLLQALDDAGAPDLRALLDEVYLSRQLADLVDLAAGSSPDSLRSLGSAATVTVARLERLATVGRRLVRPDSPPASSFFAELDLFVQGFEGRRVGYRLPFLSQSPLLVSAYAANAGIDGGTLRLLGLALARSAIADIIDSLCCCSCQDIEIQRLLAGGLALSVMDRAIDLVALGIELPGGSDADWRAAALGAIVDAVVQLFNAAQFLPPLIQVPLANLQWPNLVNGAANADNRTRRRRARQLAQVLNLTIEDERRWGELVGTIVPVIGQPYIFADLENGPDPVARILRLARANVGAIVGNWGGFQVPARARPVRMPQPIATSLNILADDRRNSVRGQTP